MEDIYKILISKILNEIIPATKKSIKKGNKIFGAAILKKSDFSTITIGTNNEIINPLFHGEISTINNYFNLKLNKKNPPSECIFLSTHEPCSLCLSAITWSGFNNFYYFFPYSDTNSKFNIPHDLKILKEVFKLNKGKYNYSNIYWKSYSILDEVKKSKLLKYKNIEKNIQQIFNEYENLSKLYQKNKNNYQIPLK